MTMDTQLSLEAQTLARLVRDRHSCRAFRPESVPRDTIEQILDVARATPSWCNTQPWHVHITEGPGTESFRSALATHVDRSFTESPDFTFPLAYEGIYRERRRVAGWQLYESLGIAKGDRVASGRQMLENFQLFGAPHVAIVTTDRSLGVYGAVDCGLFVQSFLLAAASRGVATIPQAAIASQAPLVREHLNLSDDRLVLLGISFGYADEAHPANGYRTPRQGISDVVTWRSAD
ncbi:nitroreductase [Mycolicibacterium fluoranthenivorans]